MGLLQEPAEGRAEVALSSACSAGSVRSLITEQLRERKWRMLKEKNHQIWRVPDWRQSDAQR